MFFRIPIDLYRTSVFFSSDQTHAELLCSLKKFHQPILMGHLTGAIMRKINNLNVPKK